MEGFVRDEQHVFTTEMMEHAVAQMPTVQKRRGIIVLEDIDRSLEVIGGAVLDDGSIKLDAAFLRRVAQLCGLRDGEHIKGASLKPERDEIQIYVYGGWLPRAEAGCEAPIVMRIVNL